MRIILWGTYDTGKPRTRLLRDALAAGGHEITPIHKEIWSGLEDKSQVKGFAHRAGLALRWLAAYPALVWRYMRAGKHDLVIVAYLGLIDVLVLYPFARLRGKPIVWDAFLSIYDTVVNDRAMMSPRNPLAKLLWAAEWLATRAASRIVLDTKAHGALFASQYGMDPAKIDAVFVGAEQRAFAPMGGADQGGSGTDDLQVLFYGQFIPLHGIETIVQAAIASVGQPIRWTIIGQGQDESRIASLLDQHELPKLEWIKWVDYEALAGHIGSADICLGIFGKSDKAARVIPNKVFQALAMDKPLVTRDSPAMRELVNDDSTAVYLVPPTDPAALLKALDQFQLDRANLPANLHENLRAQFELPALAKGWDAVLHKAVEPG